MSCYSPMNADYKARWLEALRGRKYIQARGYLRLSTDDNKKHCCCLGVLCDLVNPTEWDASSLNWGPSYQFRGDEGLPDKTVLKETGLTLAKARKLADLNDYGDYDFKQIADFIEKNF